VFPPQSSRCGGHSLEFEIHNWSPRNENPNPPVRTPHSSYAWLMFRPRKPARRPANGVGRLLQPVPLQRDFNWLVAGLVLAGVALLLPACSTRTSTYGSSSASPSVASSSALSRFLPTAGEVHSVLPAYDTLDVTVSKKSSTATAQSGATDGLSPCLVAQIRIYSAGFGFLQSADGTYSGPNAHTLAEWAVATLQSYPSSDSAQAYVDAYSDAVKECRSGEGGIVGEFAPNINGAVGVIVPGPLYHTIVRSGSLVIQSSGPTAETSEAIAHLQLSKAKSG